MFCTITEKFRNRINPDYWEYQDNYFGKVKKIETYGSKCIIDNKIFISRNKISAFLITSDIGRMYLNIGYVFERDKFYTNYREK